MSTEWLINKNLLSLMMANKFDWDADWTIRHDKKIIDTFQVFRKENKIYPAKKINHNIKIHPKSKVKIFCGNIFVMGIYGNKWIFSDNGDLYLALQYGPDQSILGVFSDYIW